VTDAPSEECWVHPRKSIAPAEPASRLGSRAPGVAVVLALAAIAGAALAEADADGFATERAVVERLHDALLASMQNVSTNSFEERREALRGVVDKSFDFRFMAEKSAGRYWRNLEAGDREALIGAVRDLAASNYAARFDGYDGERFETTGVEAAPHETVLVRTRILQEKETIARLDYRLRKNPAGETRIVDVFLNGTVSELAMRRAEYSSVIKREGFDALLAALRERVETLPVSARR
jgi:phospholipid transport system substrate-binding protein